MKPRSPTRLTTNALIAAALALGFLKQTDAFPAEEHLDEVVRRHQHQHGEGEEREIGEEARLVRILLHIAPAIEMDERRDRGDHHQHHCGQRIDTERPCDLEIARPDPVEHRRDRRLAAAQIVDEDRPAERARCEQRAGGQHLGDGVAEHAVAQPGDHGREERQEDDEEDQEITPSSG
jgi:hypothetical protein